MEKKKKLIDFVGFSPFLSNLSTNSRHFKSTQNPTTFGEFHKNRSTSQIP